jgi:probable phosphoglycerate mutase
MTKIILTRHGHVEGITPERFRGRLELPLTETGQRQADITATRIASVWRPVAIYTSPMGRTIATGTAIGARLGLEVQPDPRLNDIDYGAWQGLTPEDARSRWPEEVETWYRAPHLASIPGGETLQAVLARVAAALQEILRRHPNDVVVLVGHDSVNRVILLHALDMSLSRYWCLKQDPCAINEMNFADDMFIIRTINETWHLQDMSADQG